MEPSSNLNKSIKQSPGSYKQARTTHEELPILPNRPTAAGVTDPTIPNYEFRMDREEQGMGSGQSFDFMSGGKPPDDPPTILISQFLNKQKNNNGNEFTLDMDLEMDELKLNHPESSKPQFSDSGQRNESMRRRHKDFPMEELQSNQQQLNEVLGCTSNNVSFKARIFKTKSRLIDPPEEEVEMIPKSGLISRSGLIPKSGPMRPGLSGLLGSKYGDDDEDDPLADEDLPEKYRRAKFDALTLLQWLSLIMIFAALLCSLLIPFLKRKVLWELNLWKWILMVLVLICGRLVSGWGIRMAVFFIEMNFLLRKKVLYFVYGVRKAVQNCFWLGLVLLAWHFLFDKKVERETRVLLYIGKVLVCFLIGTLLWLVKTLIVKVLASSFHVSTYFDRIQDTLFNQYVIETLSGPPMIEIQQLEEEDSRNAGINAGVYLPPELRPATSSRRKGFQKSTTFMLKSGGSSRGGSKRENGISIENLHKLNSKNISAWNMKRLMNMVRHGSLSTLDEQILQGDQYLGGEDDSSKQITSEREAKAAARKIFQNVARPGLKYIIYADLMRFMRDDEALRTMSLFEGARETKRISKKSLKDWVVNAFRERRALALTLTDTKTAVNKLHHMVNIIAAAIIGVIWLLVLDIATSQFLLFVSSQLVLVAFVFGNTCKTIFESVIFLFITHPFDVGDRCEIDGTQMIVEEMNILTTLFLRYDNLKITYPNSILSNKSISNYYRSPDMADAVEFCIHVATPAEKVATMKQRIVSYIENKKEHWYASPMVVFKEPEKLNMVRMAVWMTHRMNHQNMVDRWERRGLLLEEMVKIFRELDIEYRMHPFDINVSSMPPITYTRYPPSWTPETPANN